MPAQSKEPLAIVGIGCRLPGNANDPESFWKLLEEGRSGIREVPDDRWNIERYYHPDPAVPVKMITKWGGFIDEADQFDPTFFGVSPREAQRMDPQQRWLLEVAWEAMEDAGERPADWRGSNTGVFVGIASNEYGSMQMSGMPDIDVHTNSGGTLSIASNRISYLFDFKGPSMSVDTACSSALVAINLACKSIWSGDCESALAGGVNALLVPDASIGFSKASMLSPSGQCFAFDARANGYVRGEGAGLIVIKPLSAAQRDGDRIYATIRAAVVNQDGNTSSMTVPGEDTQAAMLRQAYREAGMEPSRVTYMEAHGTGTPVGDPIETRALGEVLSDGRPEGEQCIIGSVKSNIGHLESASGIAGVIKAALVLHKGEVPLNRNYKTPNPNIPFEKLKLKVPSETTQLPRKGEVPPVAAVNSFGFGGTNAHIVLEEAPTVVSSSNWMKPNPGAQRPHILPLSARGDAALRKTADNFRDFLGASEAELADICYSVGALRDQHEDRLVVIAEDTAAMRYGLKNWMLHPAEAGAAIAGKASVTNSDPVFVFTGQGAQWWGMGQGLLKTEPVFRETIERIDALLSPLAGWSLVEEMTRSKEDSNINRTDIAQPAIFALQVALADLWKSWGVVPTRVVGHSVGEVAAAYVAGVYSLEDAVAVICHRSRLQNTTGGKGRMAAVGLSESQARTVICGRENEIEVAVVNSPGMVTLAGDTEPLEKVIGELEEAGKFVRWLRIDYAFHTHQMEPIKDKLLAALADIAPRAAEVPFYSTVTGGQLAGEKLDAAYWWSNVREAVLFAPAIKNLAISGSELFLELGPHPALAGPVNECLGDAGKKGAVLHSLKRGDDETLTILQNLAALHIEGVEADWAALNRAAGRRVDLPKYAWSHERYWLESEKSRRHRLDPIEHPLLGVRQIGPDRTWQFRLDPREFKYLEDHRFWDSIIFPAAGYAEIGLGLARSLFPDEPFAVEDLSTRKALFVSEKSVPSVRVVFRDADHSFAVHSSTDDGASWELNAEGFLRKANAEAPAAAEGIEAIRARLPKHATHQQYYDAYAEAGYQFGPNFRHLQNVWSRPHESLAEIVVPEEVAVDTGGYHFHPAVLDACFHAVKGAQVVPEGARSNELFYLPAGIRRVHLYRDRAPNGLWAHAVITGGTDDSLLSDITVYDTGGERVADIFGFRVDRVEQKDEHEEAVENALYQFQWQPSRLRGSRAVGKPDFASPATIAAAVREGTADLSERHGLVRNLEGFVPAADALGRRCVEESFCQLGWKPEKGSQFGREKFIKELGIVPEHQRLANALLGALADGGLLERVDDSTWRLLRDTERLDIAVELAALREQYPEYTADLDLFDMAWPRLAEVLSGETDPLEVLFPGGSSEKLEAFYIDGADFPANNEMLAAAVGKAVESMPERRAVRILEVGAGTGSLTRSALEALPEGCFDFTFTDNGSSFIAEAKKNFAGQGGLEFQIFDIERSPEEQGIDPGSYDLVLATNVIHATSDLKATLAVLRQCLGDDGLLMFLEVTRERVGLDLIFGLLKGWWGYTDTELRSDSALLSRERWEGLLAECGFDATASFVNTVDEAIAGQTGFVAQRGASVPTAGETPSAEADGGASSVLIFADDVEFSKSLASRFEKAGKDVIVAATAQEVVAVLDSAGAFETIVHAGGASVNPATDETDTDGLIAAQEGSSLHLLQLVHELAGREFVTSPKIHVVSRGVREISAGDQVEGLAAAPAVGLVRVARGEHPEFVWQQIDLPSAAGEFDAADVFDEIVFHDGEEEIGYRGGSRYVNRLQPVKTDELPDRQRDAVLADGEVLPYRVQIGAPGILTNLSLNETVRREPDPDEIEVSVKAGGINFRDVMKALGMYPGNPIDVKWFGDDFSGVVTRVGSGVLDIKPGDRVAGMAPYCFRSFVTVNRHMVFAAAETQSFEEAATLPTVFLTAHYALNELARMRGGERVLIHAGTGGVGMAAIQIARGLGLEIFATAGTPEKRALLLELGADHALDSRSLAFADDIMRITGGEGVDGVLNSLAGDFITKSFSVLRPFGRFVEIGKIDIYNNSKLGLEQLRNNISYFVVDLAQHLQDKPEYVAEMFAELARKFDCGEYKALPHKTFPITDVVDAFRYMAQGRHVGKNVINFDCAPIPVAPCTEEGHLFKADATYLITGGMSGFGFELAKWMARNGARHLVLMSRSGARDESILADIEAMSAEGVTFVDARGDVTSHDDIEMIVAGISADLPPLKGVIHGAMVLDDQFLVDIDEACFNKVVHPKMLGAWNLHRATLGLELDHFICFSSFSAVIGAVKQANYNAGNYFLDALADYRTARGLPALTINWGALSGAGFVDRNEKTAAYLDKLGLKPFTMADTQDVMARVLPKSASRVAASVVDWGQLVKLSPQLAASKTFSLVAGRGGEGEGGGSVRPQVLAAAPEDRHGILEDFIAIQVAGVFGTDAAKIDRDTPLTNIGLDSLMAIELMNRMESALGLNLPMGTVLNGPDIRELAANLLEQILASDDGSGAAEGQGAATAGVAGGGALPRVEASGLDLDEFPLTEGQKALWFLHQLAPESSAYTLVFPAKMTPRVDIDVMERAFTSLFERHPMLDVTFHLVDGEPVQRLRRGRSIDFREHDVSELSQQEVKAQLAEHAERPFDIENGPVVRIELFRTADDAHIVLLGMHHIVSDSWSIAVLLQDLIESYFSFKAGRDPEYPALEYRYHDFVDWQTRNLSGEFGIAASEYWRGQLGDAPSAIDLPADHLRPPVQSFNGDRYGFEIDKDLADSVLVLASNEGATLYATMLAAYNVLFHRYCGQDDIVVGSPMAGRNQGELGGIVGYFVNPVPLRSRVGDDPTFSEFLQRTASGVNGALEHQDYPLVRIVDDLKTPRDPARSPLFQISFAMERVPGVDDQGIAVFLVGAGGHKFEVGDMALETVDLNFRQSQFEISLVVEEAGGRIFGSWHYNRDLFDASTIARLNGLFARVLQQVCADPDLKVTEIDLLSPSEMQSVLHDWNSTAAEFPADKGLHTLVSEQAAKTPDATAVTAGSGSISYAQLEQRADGLACELRSRGAGAGTAIGLLAERGTEMVVAMLGILKSGAHYIPLDPDYPEARLVAMLDDAQPPLLVTTRSAAEKAPKGPWECVVSEDFHAATGAALPEFVGEDLAYVIYTSGSTGRPKGVEIGHNAAVNFLTSMRRQPGLTRVDKLLAVTTLSFDISLLEIFLPLTAGAQVVVADRDDCRDGRRLARLIDEHQISIMQATPATWRMLLDSGWEGRNGLKILCGGEAMPRDLANFLTNSADEVWNLYGPTETTVWSTCSRVAEGGGAVDIGHPIDNTQVYVLDSGDKVLPPGFVGELCIGGDGLARGYRGQPELTAERFPTIDLPELGPQRLYRTGDLARWRADGVLECLGRIDFQTKLRGVRMELGEIETELRAHAAVQSAVVVKRDDLPGGEALVAYIVTGEAAPDGLVSALKTHLSECLPEAMRPTYYELLNALPQTPNGKLDRARLPLPCVDRAALGSDFVAPQTASEILLAEIFEAAFAPREVGIRDNFFELGGDSLLAVKIVTQVSTAFNREVPLDAFLRFPSIEGLARYLHAPPEAKGDGHEIPTGYTPDTDYLSLQLVEDGDESVLPRLDAVALAYIPEAFAAASGLSREALVRDWFGGRPRLSNSYDTPWGTVGVVMLPRFEIDLYKDTPGLKPAVLDALRLAGRLGAKTVSLTGAIPAVTNDGLDVVAWMNGEGVELPIITTGDATRTATVVRSVEGILAAAGRELSTTRVAFVGLGSIGGGTLDLMLEVLPHPAGVTLCDFYKTEERLERIQDQLLASGYGGEITIAGAAGQLPDEVYQADLIIAATSVPGVIDVDKLKPGALIVDYSFPPAFRTAEAARRSVEHGDILFTTGGQLRLDADVEEAIYLPAAASELLDDVGAGQLATLAGRDGREMTGCVLASIFTGMAPEVRVTLGALGGGDALAHYRFIEGLKIAPARLQMESYFISDEATKRFRDQSESTASEVEA